MAGGPAWGGGQGEEPAGRGVLGGRKRGLSRKFAVSGALREALPSTALTQMLDAASGPGRRGGADADERMGMLGRWDATEAWCAAAKLGYSRR